jgi:hypothetical protein
MRGVSVGTRTFCCQAPPTDAPPRPGPSRSDGRPFPEDQPAAEEKDPRPSRTRQMSQSGTAPPGPARPRAAALPRVPRCARIVRTWTTVRGSRSASASCHRSSAPACSPASRCTCAGPLSGSATPLRSRDPRNRNQGLQQGGGQGLRRDVLRSGGTLRHLASFGHPRPCSRVLSASKTLLIVPFTSVLGRRVTCVRVRSPV